MVKSVAKQGTLQKSSIHVRTTVGELLAAAYEATGCRADRAADLLQHGPLGPVVGRRLRFV